MHGWVVKSNLDMNGHVAGSFHSLLAKEKILAMEGNECGVGGNLHGLFVCTLVDVAAVS